MFSDIRLVIWDLDETYWQGTLTEGGITYSDRNQYVVEELCRRGIMNSICSKNELEPVKFLLVEQGVWDYFIFPSINWLPKGERIAKIIESANLRPRNVLFIDDNRSNLAEARALIPDLNVVDHTYIDELLRDAGLVGKPDAELTRLKQYKTLEKKDEDQSRGGEGNLEFLRQSGIKVEILYDIEPHIDRAVELINRTNQLNFTKKRLSLDPEEARAQLLSHVAPFYIKSGLVSVRDKYGDYGICGFFSAHGIGIWDDYRLEHFVFSCRIMGMGVEQWVYDLLRRPRLEIQGDVSSNLLTDEPAPRIDWINSAANDSVDEENPQVVFGEVRIRGGCDLEAIDHLFRSQARSVMSEVSVVVGDFNKACHNSALLTTSKRGISNAQERFLERLGMSKTFFDTKIFDPCEDRSLIVYSPTGDPSLIVHRHKENGIEIPIWYREDLLPTNRGRTDNMARRYDALCDIVREEFDVYQFQDVSRYERRYDEICRSIPGNALFVVVLPLCYDIKEGVKVEIELNRTLNDAFKTVGRKYRNIRFIEMASLIDSLNEVRDYMHFERVVYRRLFDAIKATYREAATAGAFHGRSETVLSRLKAWSRRSLSR